MDASLDEYIRHIKMGQDDSSCLAIAEEPVQ